MEPTISAAGWDFPAAPFPEVLSSHALIPAHLLAKLDPGNLAVPRFDPVVTALDFDAGRSGRLPARATVRDGVKLVASDIEAFKANPGCDRPVVLYLGSPARPASPPLADVTSWSELLARPADEVPAGVIYAAAAVEAGADFVDFTPSESLVCPALWSRSAAAGLQLAGRDGSTGETMLKAAVATMLSLRGLRLRSWYSSNHLGNRDGLVLSDPDFSWLKIADKKRGLAELTGSNDFDHVVSIDFVRSKGDRKEAFASVVAEDIFGSEVNLRLNWQAWDSALAVPMLLDLVRLVAIGQRLGLAGVQPQLGYFFKAPLGIRCESPERAHSRMIEFYTAGR
jgi:myo-inositol-1-phosphate synthase